MRAAGPAHGHNLYLATVIDCCFRRLTGWAIAEHIRTELVIDALHAAADTRNSLSGAIFHSDHGSVYTPRADATLCDQLGVTQSMGAMGSSADKAPAGVDQRHPQCDVLREEKTYTATVLSAAA